MTGSQVGPIKDFALGIFDGPHATPKESDVGPVFLGIKNVTPQGALDLSKIRHVSEEDYPRWTKRVVPQENDIVFSYEATLHRYAVVPEGFRGCLGRRMALVRPDPAKVHAKFLHYYFLSSAWRSVVESNIISGATVDRVPLTRFPEFEIRVPSLDTQERIAAILSAYDILIENNRRRIRLLEQAVRLLYREWFVHLRFPGHEDVTISDGTPEGWERKQLGDCASFASGKTPSKAKQEFWDGTVPWVSSGELTTMRLQRTSLNLSEGAVAAGSRLVPAGTTLAVVRGMSLAKEFRVGVAACALTFNQDVKAITANAGVDKLFLFHAIDAQRDRIRELAGDASHGTKKLDMPVLAGLSLLLPPPAYQGIFGGHASAIHSQWDILDSQIVKLQQARDLLLPRLMSGEVVV